MENHNIEGVLESARQHLEAPDYLVDLYDLTFIWASPKALKLSGYTQADIGRKRSIDIIAFDEQLTEKRFREQLTERIGKGHGQLALPIKTPSGERLMITLEYHVLSYADGWYIAGQIIESLPANN